MKAFSRRAAICVCALAGLLVGVAAGQTRERVESRPERWQGCGLDAREPAGRSVADFVTANGQFDLEAIRRSGYEGPLDLAAHDVRLDPRTGRPVVGEKASEDARDHPDDIYWQPGMGVPGVGGQVYAVAVYDDALIVGGAFSVAGEAVANNIARWDGTSWSALGSGVGGGARWVSTLAIYDNALVAGGAFTIAGGKVSAYLAFWNPHVMSIDDDPDDGGDPQATVPAALAISAVAPNPFCCAVEIVAGRRLT